MGFDKTRFEIPCADHLQGAISSHHRFTTSDKVRSSESATWICSQENLSWLLLRTHTEILVRVEKHAQLMANCLTKSKCQIRKRVSICHRLAQYDTEYLAVSRLRHLAS